MLYVTVRSTFLCPTANLTFFLNRFYPSMLRINLIFGAKTKINEKIIIFFVDHNMMTQAGQKIASAIKVSFCIKICGSI